MYLLDLPVNKVRTLVDFSVSPIPHPSFCNLVGTCTIAWQFYRNILLSTINNQCNYCTLVQFFCSLHYKMLAVIVHKSNTATCHTVFHQKSKWLFKMLVWHVWPMVRMVHVCGTSVVMVKISRRQTAVGLCGCAQCSAQVRITQHRMGSPDPVSCGQGPTPDIEHWSPANNNCTYATHGDRPGIVMGSLNYKKDPPPT